MEFSNKLKELRKKKGITQEELANSIFVSRSVIAKYESGAALPTRENAQKLAEFFNVKLNKLIDEDEHIGLTLIVIKARKRISYIVSSLGIVINAIYIIICCIPIFTKLIYIYPIPDGLDQPPSDTIQNSVMSATLRNKNPMGIITFIFCLINLSLFVFMLIKMKNKKVNFMIEFFSIILLIINVFLIFFTFILSASYAL